MSPSRAAFSAADADAMAPTVSAQVTTTSAKASYLRNVIALLSSRREMGEIRGDVTHFSPSNK
jgi:hypothetical protein